MVPEQKAEWSAAYVNDLPDSSFLYVEPGGKKDETGRTVPRALRHFPVKDADGKVDAPHARNAIARIPQSNAPGLDAGKKQRLQDEARRMLEGSQKALDVVKADTIARAKAAAAKLRAGTKKGDAAGADLEAGGMKGPEQPRRPLWEPEKKAEAPAAPTPVRRVFAGIPVVVDRPKGYVQEGKAADGAAWRRVYHVDYGHIPDTKGGDGEGLDVFVGGDETAKDAHWILQRKPDGSFDEYKVMLGFADVATAKAIYCAHIPKRFLGSIATMPIEFMKALLGIEPTEIAKAEDAIRGIVESCKAEDAIALLENFGPPDEWSGAVASIAGPERRRAMQEAWAACTPGQQAMIREVWARNMGATDGTEDEGGPRVERAIKIAKAGPEAGELRYVLGVVLEPETVDGQGDVYSADEIRRTAWEYMANFRNVGLMHKGLVNGKVRLVESWIAPCDVTVDGTAVKAGSWLMGLHVVDDAIWQDVKAGKLTGLSIGGFARREPVAASA
jgi:hypothetical protein